MANQLRSTFDLDLLRIFLAVLDTGGFTAAARAFNTTQSTVSMQIRRLETQLDAPLFRRLGRQVEPTPTGERLQAYARQLLTLNNQAWNDLTSGEPSGRVRLGVPDDYAFYLPEIIRSFREQYPAVDLQLTCDLSVSLMRRLEAGTLDLALVTRHPRTPGGEVLRREPLVWVSSSSHQPEQEPVLPLSLFPQDTCVFRERALAALEETGRSWRVAYTSMSLTGQQAIVGAGLAVTVLIPSVISPELRIVEDGELPALTSVEIALHRRAGRPSEGVRRLTEMIRERVAAQ
ncbi:LysR family transcriptional regulator [Fodinicurvata halophila]|uniref:LysR family transcriptional regulator n=1 Tax=Fodinicurvata halophila TaxID=1419723 RepID=A0ABV8UR25_9PROT